MGQWRASYLIVTSVAALLGLAPGLNAVVVVLAPWWWQFSAGLYGLIPNVKGDPETRSAVEKVRLKIAERGGLNGIRTLAAIMRTMDNSGTLSRWVSARHQDVVALERVVVTVFGGNGVGALPCRCRRQEAGP